MQKGCTSDLKNHVCRRFFFLVASFLPKYELAKRGILLLFAFQLMDKTAFCYFPFLEVKPAKCTICFCRLIVELTSNLLAIFRVELKRSLHIFRRTLFVTIQ